MKAASIPHIFLSILVFSILSACKEWSAQNMILVEDNGQETIVVIEKKYTITQSETRGGSSFRSGYTTYYLTNYDAKTGEEIQSIQIGDSKNKAHLIAQRGRKIWLYASKDENFFHSRDAFTLEVIDNQSSIAKKNPDWNDEFIAGNAFNSPYELDNSSDKVFFSSSSGRIYSFHPETLKISPEEDKPSIGSQSLSRNMAFYKDSLKVLFEGEGRRNLVINKVFYEAIYEKLADELEELDDQGDAYLKELRDQNLPFRLIKPKRDSIRNVIRAKRDSNYSFRELYIRGEKKQDLYEEISFIKPNVLCDLYYTKEKRFNESIRNKDQVLFSESRNLFFVTSDSKIGDDKKLQISALTLFPEVEIHWTIELENLEKYYRLQSVDVGKNYLVMAFEKSLLCINLSNGTIAWQKEY